MQISELSWKKASYVEATSYILPDSDKELGDVKGWPPTTITISYSKQGNKKWTIKKVELATDS